jgi:hypothetical protein
MEDANLAVKTIMTFPFPIHVLSPFLPLGKEPTFDLKVLFVYDCDFPRVLVASLECSTVAISTV